jgi:TonB family protein
MLGTHERARSSDATSPRLRSSRVIVVLVLIICYAALFYAVAHTRGSRYNADGPSMFKAIVSELGERRAGMSSRSFVPIEDQTTDPLRHWIFPPIDIWPSPPGWSATLSEFTSVTDARPDPAAEEQDYSSIAKPSARRPVLRMTRWLRPEYPMEWVLAGKEGAVLLGLRIDPSGQPAEIMVTRSSASRELDESATRAARLWRFSPPRWNARPVEVWAQVEVRYHRSADRE